MYTMFFIDMISIVKIDKMNCPITIKVFLFQAPRQVVDIVVFLPVRETIVGS